MEYWEEKHMRKYRKHSLWLCFLMLANVFAVCGCTWKLFDKLGFDTYDYHSEPVIANHDPDSAIGSSLAAMIDILAGETGLPEFTGMNRAIEKYRDAILSYMLTTEYARYSGNRTLIEQAEEAYPAYQITQLIPAREFEATMYQYFGGSVKITNKDTNRFRYLQKVDAYIATAAFVPVERDVHITEIAETEHTYRVRFTVQWQEDTSREYTALIVKREDGTQYFKELTKYAAETESETTESQKEESPDGLSSFCRASLFLPCFVPDGRRHPRA